MFIYIPGAVLLAGETQFRPATADSGGVQVAASPGSTRLHGIKVLDDNSAAQYPPSKGKISMHSGARSIHQLKRALKLVQTGEIDAVLFAPLNKSSLKLAGMTEENKLRWFANQLDFKGATNKINIAGPLWTGRVTSHIRVEEVTQRITKESTLSAIELLHRLRYVSVNVYSLRYNDLRQSSGSQELSLIA